MGDDGDAAGRAVPCSSLSPPSRRPSSLATVGGGTARASLNLEPFWAMGGADCDGVAGGGMDAVMTAGGDLEEG
jgi:hypothetical protein